MPEIFTPHVISDAMRLYTRHGMATAPTMMPKDLQGLRDLDTTHDWIDALPKTDHTDFFTNVDWAKTPLGALRQWPAALRMYTHMVMSDSRAACLYWYSPITPSQTRAMSNLLLGDLHR
jgi:hypothetical protein